MIDSLTDAIVVVDRQRRVVAANRRYQQLFGIGREHVEGMLCDDAVRCPEAADGAAQRCPACRARNERVPQRQIREAPGEDGMAHRWEVTFDPILDASGEVSHVVEVWRDISDRTALEAQLSHSERLASIGILAAGVAHEINNPLASILASVEALGRMLKRGEDGAESRAEALDILALAEREIARCRSITDRLVLLAQPYSAAPAWVNLSRAVEETGSLLRHQLVKQDVTWMPELDPELPPIWARESGVRGVCLNLMMNAVQAMSNGGTLRAVTSRHEGFAQLVIEDTGPGIRPEHLPRIWDPFFTTKPPGQGTGLGLFVTHNIVTINHGTIHAENRPSGGARFVVRWPLHAKEPGVNS